MNLVIYLGNIGVSFFDLLSSFLSLFLSFFLLFRVTKENTLYKRLFIAAFVRIHLIKYLCVTCHIQYCIFL